MGGHTSPAKCAVKSSGLACAGGAAGLLVHSHQSVGFSAALLGGMLLLIRGRCVGDGG